MVCSSRRLASHVMCIVSVKRNGMQCTSQVSVDNFQTEFTHFDERVTCIQTSWFSSQVSQSIHCFLTTWTKNISGVTRTHLHPVGHLEDPHYSWRQVIHQLTGQYCTILLLSLCRWTFIELLVYISFTGSMYTSSIPCSRCEVRTG